MIDLPLARLTGLDTPVEFGRLLTRNTQALPIARLEVLGKKDNLAAVVE